MKSFWTNSLEQNEAERKSTVGAIPPTSSHHAIFLLEPPLTKSDREQQVKQMELNKAPAESMIKVTREVRLEPGDNSLNCHNF